MNWTAIITAGLSSLFGSLLEIVATPTLQHHFWRRQRRAELKLKTVEVVNTLANRFIQQWIAADFRKERYKPTLDWYEEPLMRRSKLFSGRVHTRYSRIWRKGSIRTLAVLAPTPASIILSKHGTQQ
jgi:hypothetical protein